MVSTVIPVAAQKDILEITVKQVNCFSGAGFTAVFFFFSPFKVFVGL